MKFKRLIIILLLFSWIFSIFVCDVSAERTATEKIAAHKIYETNITTITLFFILFLSFILVAVPRRHILAPFIIAACFVPTDQRFILDLFGFTEGIDFTIMRLLILFGIIRLFISRDVITIKRTKFDTIIISWAIASSLAYILRVQTVPALINRCGFLFDVLGIYWLFRQTVRSWDDIKFCIKIFAFCMLFIIPFIIWEKMTENNLFSHLGRMSTSIRAGKLRCQGSFPHPIIFGIFWAGLLPLFIGMTKISKQKLFYYCVIGACIFSIIVSNSSTPISMLVIILMLFPLFRWRKYTWNGVRIAFYLALISQLFKSLTGRPPIWHILASVKIVSASTGWHRYNLINQFILHFNEWWLVGTNSTAHWDMWGKLGDVTNQFVAQGITGGILGLGLFIALLVMAFSCLVSHFQNAKSLEEQWLSWCLWVALVAHIASFVGVAHFGQISMLWYLQLAMIGFIYEKQSKKRDIYFTAKGAKE